MQGTQTAFDRAYSKGPERPPGYCGVQNPGRLDERVFCTDPGLLSGLPDSSGEEDKGTNSVKDKSQVFYVDRASQKVILLGTVKDAREDPLALHERVADFYGAGDFTDDSEISGVAELTALVGGAEITKVLDRHPEYHKDERFDEAADYESILTLREELGLGVCRFKRKGKNDFRYRSKGEAGTTGSFKSREYVRTALEALSNYDILLKAANASKGIKDAKHAEDEWKSLNLARNIASMYFTQEAKDKAFAYIDKCLELKAEDIVKYAQEGKESNIDITLAGRAFHWLIDKSDPESDGAEDMAKDVSRQWHRLVQAKRVADSYFSAEQSYGLLKDIRKGLNAKAPTLAALAKEKLIDGNTARQAYAWLMRSRNPSRMGKALDIARSYLSPGAVRATEKSIAQIAFENYDRYGSVHRPDPELPKRKMDAPKPAIVGGNGQTFRVPTPDEVSYPERLAKAEAEIAKLRAGYPAAAVKVERKVQPTAVPHQTPRQVYDGLIESGTVEDLEKAVNISSRFLSSNLTKAAALMWQSATRDERLAAEEDTQEFELTPDMMEPVDKEDLVRDSGWYAKTTQPDGSVMRTSTLPPHPMPPPLPKDAKRKIGRSTPPPLPADARKDKMTPPPLPSRKDGSSVSAEARRAAELISLDEVYSRGTTSAPQMTGNPGRNARSTPPPIDAVQRAAQGREPMEVIRQRARKLAEKGWQNRRESSAPDGQKLGLPDVKYLPESTTRAAS